MKYVRITSPHQEYQYINLLKDIFNNGHSKSDRTGTGESVYLVGKFVLIFQKVFRILTSKFVPFKSVIKELLWILNGQTNNKILQNQSVQYLGR